MSPAPSLLELREQLAGAVPPGRGNDESVRRQWWAALTVLQEQLLQLGCPEGLWLASPLPALHEPDILSRCPGWVWTPAGWKQRAPELPASIPDAALKPRLWQLPLQEDDGTDPLLVLITGPLQVALALHGKPGRRQLLARFEPQLLAELLQQLGRRMEMEDTDAAEGFKRQVQQLGALEPCQHLAASFWPQVAAQLAKATPSLTLVSAPKSDESAVGGDQLGLLEALAHEVRTPLATIRTLIRSLQRRSDLQHQHRQRLEQIDQECSEQIDRFGLIFQAAELERAPRSDRPLARTNLSDLLPQLEEAWQRQLKRRELDFHLRKETPLPHVMSDPALLESMLLGLMDRFSRGLRRGDEVMVTLSSAGDRLKLRFSGAGDDDDFAAATDNTSVGPVLSWDPATGSLQLSPQAIQRLFASLGGRLTERPGHSLTLYLPLANVEGHEGSGNLPEQTLDEC